MCPGEYWLFFPYNLKVRRFFRTAGPSLPVKVLIFQASLVFRSMIFSSIRRIGFQKCFGDLAAAGIMDADKCHLFHHSFSFALILQIIWVMVPMGQKLHQVRGLKSMFTAKPMMVEVSIRL